MFSLLRSFALFLRAFYAFDRCWMFCVIIDDQSPFASFTHCRTRHSISLFFFRPFCASMLRTHALPRSVLRAFVPASLFDLLIDTRLAHVTHTCLRYLCALRATLRCPLSLPRFTCCLHRVDRLFIDLFTHVVDRYVYAVVDFTRSFARTPFALPALSADVCLLFTSIFCTFCAIDPHSCLRTHVGYASFIVPRVCIRCFARSIVFTFV